MKEKLLTNQNTNIFESIKKIDKDGNEYWLARELMPLLEYDKWTNFDNVIARSIQSLKSTYPQTEDHFTEVGKKIKVAVGTIKETVREVKDYKLSRRACYLIAQNGDSRKEAIALAQNYFAEQTRKQEIREVREKDVKRILARRKLTESDKKLSGVMTSRGVDGPGIAEIKSAGDQALFGESTKQVKEKMGIKKSKPLADHLPTISIKAKDLATEMTTYKTQQKNIHGKYPIKNIHVDNNSAVRNMLTASGIYPEQLPAEEDIKKLEKKYTQKQINKISDSKLMATDILEIDIRSITDKTKLDSIKNTIVHNQGSSILRIYYGSMKDTKMIEREIQINPEVVSALRPYLIFTDASLGE
jgi:DNA-damage-inducible protein D